MYLEPLYYFIWIVSVSCIIYLMQCCISKIRILILARKLPGPKAWPIIGNGIEFLQRDVDFLDKIWKYNQKYGLVRFWFGPNLNVFVCTAEDAAIYYSTPAILDRSEHFDFLRPVFGNGILTSNGSAWKKTKKFFEPLFRFSNLKKYFPVYEEQTNLLIGLLEKEVGKSVCYIYDYIKCCTFEIISSSLFEEELNAQVENLKILDDTDVLMKHIANRMFSLLQQNDFLFGLTEAGKDYFDRLASALGFIEKVVALKRKSVEEKLSKSKIDEENVENLTFVEKMFSPGVMSDDEIRDHLTTITATGYESSACEISFALVMLGIHQDVQEKLYQELFSATQNGLNDNDLAGLEYLNKVIKETMRLFPAAPLLFRRATEDVQFGKHLVPRGASININIFAIHRSPKYYDNPNDFNPENFSKENIASRHPYAFIPFGMGVRKCIGEKVAWMSLRKIIMKILLNYKIECDLKMEEISVRMEITMKMTNGFPIRLVKRQTATSILV